MNDPIREKRKDHGAALPWIVAHRGAMAEAPENTRSAFDRALSYPIDGIEFDVQMSKDEVPIIHHNKTLHKINGKKSRVAAVSHRELETFDWGKWYGKAFSGEPLVTFEQMLKTYHAKTRLLIEIKSDEKEVRSGRTRILTLNVLDLIKKNVPDRYLKNIFILSFDRNVLSASFEIAPHLRHVFNIPGPFPKVDQVGVSLNRLYAFCCSISKLNRGFINQVHGKNLNVMTYSCNTAGQIKKALKLGVDVVMTDHPGWLFEYLKIKRYPSKM